MASLKTVCVVLFAICTLQATVTSKKSSYSKEFLAFLKTGTNEKVEPCDDFFEFACGRFAEDLRAQGRLDSSETNIGRHNLIFYDLMTQLARRIDKTSEAKAVGHLPVNVRQMLNKCKSLPQEGIAAEESYMFDYMLDTLKLRTWVNGHTSGKTWSQIRSEINPFEISLIIDKDFGPFEEYGPTNPAAKWSYNARTNGINLEFYTWFDASANSKILLKLLAELNSAKNLATTAEKALDSYHKTPYFTKYSSNSDSGQRIFRELGLKKIGLPNDLAKYRIVTDGVTLFMKNQQKIVPSVIEIAVPVDEMIDVWNSKDGEGVYLSMISRVAYYFRSDLMGLILQTEVFPRNDLQTVNTRNYRDDRQHDFVPLLPVDYRMLIKKANSATVRCLGTMASQVHANSLLLYITKETLAMMNWGNVEKDAAKMLNDVRLETMKLYTKSSWGRGDKKFMKYVHESLDAPTMLAGVKPKDAFSNKKAVDVELSGMKKHKSDGTFVSFVIAMNQFSNEKRIGRKFNSDKRIQNTLEFNAGAKRKYVEVNLPLFSSAALFTDAQPVAKYAITAMTVAHEFEHATMTGLHKFAELRHKNMGEETQALYKKNRQCLVTSYDNNCQQVMTEAGKTMKICDNGAIDFPENIADTVGIRVAYSLFKADKAYGRLDTITVSNRRLSPDQQFFLAFAKGWCSKKPWWVIKEQAHGRNAHAPEYMRANGAVKNFRAFADAFHCAPDAGMNQADKCRLFENA